MTSQAQIDACRANGRKSRGPITAQGLARSSMNALKHGRRSKKRKFLEDDSFTYETRRCKWMASEDAQTDMAEYLVARTASLACEEDRAKRSHLERLRTAIDESDDVEIEEVHALGERLFHDPAGHRSLYGMAPAFHPEHKKTSGNGEVPDPNHPGALVRKLESSEMGCLFLRSAWQELRSKLDEPDRSWNAVDRFKAIRLLGGQPVEAIEDYRIAEIFVASTALRTTGRKSEFEDLKSEMPSSQHESYCESVWAEWPELKSARKPAEARAILIDLCDQNLEELTEKLAEFEENADSSAQRTVDRLSSDESREGKDSRAYMLKCTNAFSRAVETLRKFQKKKDKDQGGREYQEPRKIEDFSRWVGGRRPRTEDAELMAADTSWATMPYPSELPVAPEQDAGTRAEQMDASDHAPTGALFPLDGERDALEHEVHSVAASAGRDSHDESASDDLAEPGDAMIPQDENSRKATNDPNSSQVARNSEPVVKSELGSKNASDPRLDNVAGFARTNLEPAAVCFRPGLLIETALRAMKSMSLPVIRAPS